MSKALAMAVIIFCGSSFFMASKQKNNDVVYTAVVGPMSCENCMDELAKLFGKKERFQQGSIASGNLITDSLTYYWLHEKRPQLETVILPKIYATLVDTIQFWPILIETNLAKGDTLIYTYPEIFTADGLVQKSFRKKLKNKLKR